jgi:hypothetical protein
VDRKKYYKSVLNFPRLNQLRYRDSRRTIPFLDGSATVVLYSATEMDQLYGKRISSCASESDIGNKNIGFVFSGDHLKEQYIR